MAACSAAFGIVCALQERSRSGLGQVIDAAMVDGAMNLMAVFAAAIHHGDWGEYGTNVLDTGSHFYETYETSDGGYMAVGAMEPQFYDAFVTTLGLAGEELPHQMDPSGWPTMKERGRGGVPHTDRDEWTAAFEGLDACVVPVLWPTEAPHHPYNTARDAFVSVDGPGGEDPTLQPTPAPRLSRTPGAVAGPTPAAGEHTREILAELGCSADEIGRLAAEGAVAWPGP